MAMIKEKFGNRLLAKLATLSGFVGGLVAVCLVGCSYIPPSDDQPPMLPPQSADPLQCTNVDACQPPQGHEVIKNSDTSDNTIDDSDTDNSAPVTVPPALQKT